MISIQVRQSGEDKPYHLGTVIPTEDYFADTRLKKNPEGFWSAVVTGLWSEWRDEVEHPNSDSEFIDWLCDEKGWSKTDDHFVVEIET